MTAVKYSSCRTSGSAFVSRGGEGAVRGVPGRPAAVFRLAVAARAPDTERGCLSIRDEEVSFFL